MPNSLSRGQLLPVPQLPSLSPILFVSPRQSGSCLLGRIKCLPPPRAAAGTAGEERAGGLQRGPRSIRRGNSRLQVITRRDAPCTWLHRMAWYMAAEGEVSIQPTQGETDVPLHGEGGWKGPFFWSRPGGQVVPGNPSQS